MADPFDALHRPLGRTEPEPAFTAALLARIDSALDQLDLDGVAPAAAPTTDHDEEAPLMELALEPTRTHRIDRRRVGRLATLALALAAAGLLLVAIVVRRGTDDSAPVAPSLPEPTSLVGAIAASADVAADPAYLGLAGDQLWVLESGGMERFDGATLRPVDRLPQVAFGGLQEASPVAGFGSMWVQTAGGPIRFDLAIGERTAQIEVPGGTADQQVQFISDVGIGDDAVWTLAQGSPPSLVRIDPATNAVETVAPLTDSPRSVAFGEGSVWVTHAEPGAFAVTRHDPSDGHELARIPLGFEPGLIRVGAAGVWVNGQAAFDGAAQGAWTIAHIDPAANRLQREIAVTGPETHRFPFEFTDLALTETAAWTTTPSGLVRIDAAADAVTVRYDGPFTGGVVADQQHVWVGDRTAGTVSRIDVG